MKRTSFLLITLSFLFLLGNDALGIEIKVSGEYSHDPRFSDEKIQYLSFSTKDPGIPPEKAFPLVCYVISMPYSLVREIKTEAHEFRVGGGKDKKTELTEKYKNGVPVPMITGYFIVSSDFYITYLNSNMQKIDFYDLQKLNDKRIKSFSYIKPPRWSWNGALAAIQWLSSSSHTKTMVYTMGVPLDPNYVPKVKKPYFIPLSVILEGGQTNVWPKENDFDATVINFKPGMKFKVIDKDFIIP